MIDIIDCGVLVPEKVKPGIPKFKPNLDFDSLMSQ